MPKKSLFIHRIFKFLALKAIFTQTHHAQKPARIDLALTQKHASGDLHGQFMAVAMPKKLIGVAWRVLTKLLGDEFTLFIRANAHYQVLARNETQIFQVFRQKIQPAVAAKHHSAFKFIAKALFKVRIELFRLLLSDFAAPKVFERVFVEFFGV